MATLQDRWGMSGVKIIRDGKVIVDRPDRPQSTEEAEKFGGEGSGNAGHAGRPGEVGGSAPAGTSQGAEKSSGWRSGDAGIDKFLSLDNKARGKFVDELSKDRLARFGQDYEDRWNIFFGIDWVGQDQAGSILKFNDMVGDYYGYKPTDQDVMDVFSKMRPTVAPQLALMVKQLAFTQFGADNKPVDMSAEYFSQLLKEKEYSKEMFEKTFGKEATVYKGVPNRFSGLVTKMKSGSVKVKDMPLSSYTIDKEVAKNFAGKGGFVLKRKVSSDEVWFGVHSNRGFSDKYGDYEWGEGEVVIGNKSPYTKFKPEDIEGVM